MIKSYIAVGHRLHNLDWLARRAKEFSREKSIQLTTARNRIARDKRFKSWKDMLENVWILQDDNTLEGPEFNIKFREFYLSDLFDPELKNAKITLPEGSSCYLAEDVLDDMHPVFVVETIDEDAPEFMKPNTYLRLSEHEIKRINEAVEARNMALVIRNFIILAMRLIRLNSVKLNYEIEKLRLESDLEMVWISASGPGPNNNSVLVALRHATEKQRAKSPASCQVQILNVSDEGQILVAIARYKDFLSWKSEIEFYAGSPGNPDTRTAERHLSNLPAEHL